MFDKTLFLMFSILFAVRPNIPALAQETSASYLQDRGGGIPASMFGTYIHKGELLVFPFFEHSLDNDREYQPAQFGANSDIDFTGKYRSYGGQIFMGYGVTDWLALEFEVAYKSAKFEKSPEDLFGTPAKINESGFGDFESQVRLRLSRESERNPEIFGFVEVTAASLRDKFLIGDKDWDLRPGIGLVKGFSWGTMTIRTDLEYTRVDKRIDIGETSLEYLKRLSPSFRIYAGMEGGEGATIDEWDLVTGVQWRVTPFVVLKLDNALGITPKATDFAPQFGTLFDF